NFQTEDLDAYDSDCDDVSNAKAVLMANLFTYGFCNTPNLGRSGILSPRHVTS
nr:hypothetical protein [Tanacetum cinerariifolium]